MWCGFCGAYTGAASKGEECPRECAPPALPALVPFAEQALDPQGTE